MSNIKSARIENGQSIITTLDINEYIFLQTCQRRNSIGEGFKQYRSSAINNSIYFCM